jgi:hypothetical protein
MNSGIGDLLREGIDRATAGERLPPGLAARARQRHRRRALTVRAAAVTGTAAVAAAAVFAATTGGTPAPGGGGSPALTTAYVVGRTEQALAAAERGGFIYRVNWVSPWTYLTVDEPMVSGHPSKEVRLNSLKVVRATTWFYRGRTRTEGFAAGGQVAIDLGPSTPTRARGPQPPGRLIAVDPNARQWFHPLHPMPPGTYPVPHSCNARDDWLAGGPLSSAQFAVLVKKALSCGQFRADGQQRVNGARALRLAGTPRLLQHLRGDEWGRNGPRAVTLWVNATTFLPVRVTVSGWLIPYRTTTDFGWLKPTPANLAMLRVKVPAGMHEVRLPAHSLLLGMARPVDEVGPAGAVHNP